ncbi:MAG: hypothetical protein WC099_03420 [Candidatus Paceibacterota bacterium]
MSPSFKQLHTEFFRQKKHDIIFVVIGVILLLLLLIVFISSIRFLSVSVDTAIDNQGISDTQTKFNIDSLQGLGIMENSSPASSVISTSSPQ